MLISYGLHDPMQFFFAFGFLPTEITQIRVPAKAEKPIFLPAKQQDRTWATQLRKGLGRERCIASRIKWPRLGSSKWPVYAKSIVRLGLQPMLGTSWVLVDSIRATVDRKVDPCWNLIGCCGISWKMQFERGCKSCTLTTLQKPHFFRLF